MSTTYPLGEILALADRWDALARAIDAEAERRAKGRPGRAPRFVSRARGQSSAFRDAARDLRATAIKPECIEGGVS